MTSTLQRDPSVPLLPEIPPVPSDLPLPTLTEIGREVMERRILPRDERGVPQETPQECFWRVAWTVAGGSYPTDVYVDSAREFVAETKRMALARQYYGLMASLDFLPNSPCLVNAGRELGQLSACFVLPVPDSIEGIFEAVKQTAMIHKSGGGTGFDFSLLRPAGSHVGSTSGVASGPVTFMTAFDAATAAIKQGGSRRGANMGNLSINHPDIWSFIEMKAALNEEGVTHLENFNISVTVTDEFMEALADAPDAEWRESEHTPREIWERMAEGAWATGDPGVIFIDSVNRSTANPVPDMGPIRATNPCGEQPLYDFDSCNLGSINLSHFASPGYVHGVDWDRLLSTVELAVRFLDDVITVNRYPLPEIERVTRQIRRIGLGVMGWADMLIALGIRYNSQEARELGREVMRIISKCAKNTSRTLGIERGSYPANSDGLSMRNSTRTTIAPTGTISLIAGCSSGIEPLFSPVFKRRHKLVRENADAWFEMYDGNESFIDLVRGALGGDVGSGSALGAIADGAPVRSLLERYPDVFSDEILLYAGANEISFVDHVAMQAAFQAHTDNGVSKTINLPEDATVDDIMEAYRLAYVSGCLGITVYRNNCRAVQVLGGSKSAAVSPQEPAQAAVTPDPVSPDVSRRKLPVEGPAIRHKFQVGDLEGYIHVGLFPDGSPGEVFINASKQGSTINGLLDTVAMLTSFALQYGIPLPVLCDKMRTIRFEPAGMTTNRSIPFSTSIVDYVFRWLELKFSDPDIPATDDVSEPGPSVDLWPSAAVPTVLLSGQGCPDCGSLLIHTEGCDKCRVCGYSSC